MAGEKIEDMSGLIAATFTPMREDGRLDLDKIPEVVERLLAEGVEGLFVCGGTGEGVSLTTAERKKTAAAFVKAAAGRIPVIVHVGHNSLITAQQLAEHAASVGAAAIAAMSPNYFKPATVDTLIDCLQVITDGAPHLPFVYYHFPAKSGLSLDLVTLLKRAASRLPSFSGVKFTDTRIFDLQAALEVENNRFRFFFGADEMLLAGLSVGAHGAIGSTYNFAAPLYQRLIAAQREGDLSTARTCQTLSVKMVRAFLPYGSIEGQKAIMSLVGLDCGPCRLPNRQLSSTVIDQLRLDLEVIGFFDWARS